MTYQVKKKNKSDILVWFLFVSVMFFISSLFYVDVAYGASICGQTGNNTAMQLDCLKSINENTFNSASTSLSAIPFSTTTSYSCYNSLIGDTCMESGFLFSVGILYGLFFIILIGLTHTITRTLRQFFS